MKTNKKLQGREMDERQEQELQQTNLNQPGQKEEVSLDDDQFLEEDRDIQQDERGSGLTDKSDRRL